jgi:hypothetical protein
MLTLFTTPKPFKGHFDVIQRNAIRSWTLLKPKPQIIVIDEVEGVVEAAREFGFNLVCNAKRNNLGTPLLSAIFEIAQNNAANDVVCYINADIILTQSFIEGVKKVAELFDGKPFLLVGQRWNVYLSKPWDFDDGDWEKKLWNYAKDNGYQESPGATDYFAFPKGTFSRIPDFAVGRGAWDGWFLWNARNRNIPLIDATSVIKIYHQQHDYSHLKSGKNCLTDRECRVNQKLRGTFLRQFNILDSNYILESEGLLQASKGRSLRAWMLRCKMCLIYYLQRWYPFSYPVVILLKALRRAVTFLLKCGAPVPLTKDTEK